MDEKNLENSWIAAETQRKKRPMTRKGGENERETYSRWTSKNRARDKMEADEKYAKNEFRGRGKGKIQKKKRGTLGTKLPSKTKALRGKNFGFISGCA